MLFRPRANRIHPKGLGQVCAGLLLLAWQLGAEVAPRPIAPASEWWAFQPLRDAAAPGEEGHPVDRWVRTTLKERGVPPNPVATPRERVRRLFFVLLGLPPTPQEIARFESNPTPEAWAALVDELLARPQYGERWARHWLDVVRYAQSNGYERDGEKHFAWRYRDYVVRAFNQDKPYADFIREQLAGDEIAAELHKKGEEDAGGWKDALIATGFLRLGVLDDEPDDKLQAEYDDLDDIVSTTGAAFLGMTIGCARCHEHKFDPIPQEDYYRFVSFFRPLRAPTSAAHSLDSSIFAPLASPGQIEDWKRGQREKAEDLDRQAAAEQDMEKRKRLTQEAQQARQAAPPFEWALAARERVDAVPAVHVLGRGNPRSPGAEVKPGFLAATGGGLAAIAPGGTNTSGRRRALAEWIASPSNPLTARVLVNRVWHHHFGRGIVRTTTDFGKAGGLPSHPGLLDWLAHEFLSRGGSLKQLHRLLVTSETWQQSSSTINPRGLEVDPGNDLLWRQNLRRLDAEALRDGLLAISGRLNLTAGGRGFFPPLSGEVLAGGSRPGTDWQISSTEEQSRRSLYAYVRRTSMIPFFETFDYSNVTGPLGERPITTVSPQALLMMNDSFVQEQAAALASRLRGEASNPGVRSRLAAMIHDAFLAATGRRATVAEVGSLEAYFDRQQERYEGLRREIHFRPDVPDTLSTAYHQALPASRFLVGPTNGWDYFKGTWPRDYEGNKNMQPGRGPYAIWKGDPWSEGRLEVTVRPQEACESIGILLANAGEGNSDEGLELVLEPRGQRILLRRLTSTNETVLAEAPGRITRDSEFDLVFTRLGDQLSVHLGLEPKPAIQHAINPSSAYRVGVRVWGASAGFETFRILRSDGDVQALWPERPQGWAEAKALESLCLLVLNLNEVCYVD